MTPLAAKLFRGGDEEMQRDLARYQFFECSSLFTMAREMIVADVESGGATYSGMAQLPAPDTAIEFMWGEKRMLALCEQTDDVITYRLHTAWGSDGELLYQGGFRLGTSDNFGSEWNSESGFRLAAPAGKTVEQIHTEQVLGTNSLLEKMLCMINQPDLVERRAQETDKRVTRTALARRHEGPAKWHECRIRPGIHGSGASSDGDVRQHQLHYVRKHFKPSLDRWVDGYWRGNADLGIHLKWYSLGQ
jgi:hypothetical protein